MSRKPKKAPRSRWARLRDVVVPRLAALRLGLPLASVVVVSAVGAPALWAWARHHPYFGLSDVRISGHGRVTREEVLGWSGVQFGASTWDLSVADVQHRLESQTWIQHAEVRTEMPGTLIVRIHERKPMAIVRLDTLYYMDRRGHLLGPLRDGDSPDFPIITGLEGEENRDRTLFALPRAAQLMRWCERRKCFDGISELRVGNDNSITVYPLERPVAIVFGWGNWKAKMARLERVWKAYQGNEQQLASIDLSYRDFVVVKTKDDVKKPAPTPGRKGTRI